MIFLEIREKDRAEYNNFVATSPGGSFLQSWEWGEWQSDLGRDVYRYWILDDINNRVGSVQFIKMPLPFGRYYLYAPYGPVLAAEENFKFQISNFKLATQRMFPDTIFIRLEPKCSQAATSYSLLATKSPNIQPGKTLLIDLLKSPDQLLADMHHKTRYNIKLAQKHGVEIKDEFDVSVGNGLFFEEALKLIVETSRRQKFNSFPASYYKKLVDFYTLHNRGELKLHIYKAVFQKRLLAAAIMMDFGQTRTFLFGGSSDSHKNVMAPYLLHWQAMLDAKNSALDLYDFWGVETSAGDVPGFVRFKLGFGPQSGAGIQQYTGAYDLVNNRAGYWVYKNMRRLNRRLKKSAS